MLSSKFACSVARGNELFICKGSRISARLGDVSFQRLHLLLKQPQPLIHAVQPLRHRLVCQKDLASKFLLTEHRENGNNRSKRSFSSAYRLTELRDELRDGHSLLAVSGSARRPGVGFTRR